MDEEEQELPKVVKTFSLMLQLPNRSVVRETVDREEMMSGELFDALVAAIARKYDAVVVDIKEV